MSTYLGLPACTLTILLSSDLAVCVDDNEHPLTNVEKRWGLTGPLVDMRTTVPTNCTCANWASTSGACWHALDLRALVVHTIHQLRISYDTPPDQHSVAVKRAVAVAHLLVAPRPHLWPGMLPGHLRPGTPGWGEQA